MQASDVAILRALPLFSEIAETRFADVATAAFLQRFPAGVDLVREGDLPDVLHVLVVGQVALRASDGNAETTLSVVTVPAPLILGAIIAGSASVMTARTLVPSALIHVPASLIASLFRDDPAFARACAVEMAQRHRAAVKDLKNLRLRTAIERLANWIVVRERLAGGTGHFTIDMEKRALAGQLGMRPENLSRNFAELAAHGVVVDGPDVRIVDRTALITFCRPNPFIDDPEP